MAQHLEHHAHVGPIHTADLEVVQEHDGALAQFVRAVWVPDTLQEFYLVERRLRVVGGALNDLEGDKLLVGQVPAEPHRREVAPAQFPANKPVNLSMTQIRRRVGRVY